MNKIINDASINEWFSQQMASLTPMKMVLALAMGFVVGLIIAGEIVKDIAGLNG